MGHSVTAVRAILEETVSQNGRCGGNSHSVTTKQDHSQGSVSHYPILRPVIPYDLENTMPGQRQAMERLGRVAVSGRSGLSHRRGGGVFGESVAQNVHRRCQIEIVATWDLCKLLKTSAFRREFISVSNYY